MSMNKFMIEIYVGILKHHLVSSLGYDKNNLVTIASSLFTH